MKKISILALLFALGQSVGLAQDLRSLSVADVKAAQTDADAHQDAIASRCYSSLLERLEAPQRAPVGILSAYQRARDVDQFAHSQALRAACAELAIDALLSIRSLPQIMVWPPR